MSVACRVKNILEYEIQTDIADRPPAAALGFHFFADVRAARAWAIQEMKMMREESRLKQKEESS